MKLLAICDPSRYDRPPLDVPTFYQRAAYDPNIDFYHIPTTNVLNINANAERIPVAPAQGKLTYDQFVNLGSKANHWEFLESFNLVFCRTLKPFPNDYLAKLKAWENRGVLFVNSPTGIEQQIQIDFFANVAQHYTPETIVTADWEVAYAFFEKHQIVVVKQENSCGGRGVFKVWYENKVFKVDHLNLGTQEFNTFAQAMDYLQGVNFTKPIAQDCNTLKWARNGSTTTSKFDIIEYEEKRISDRPLQFVRYLKRVSEGDKRIVVVDGEIYGAYVRRSKSGHWVNNVSGDGECVLSEISPLERAAIEKTVPFYRDRGLMTLGYDFLMDDDGNWVISEINAGNIGGFARLELLTHHPTMDRFLNWLTQFARRKARSRLAVV